jgi:hypothetical protein
MTILLAPKDRQGGLDNVDGSEEVGLELILYQCQGPRTLAQFLYSAHNNLRMATKQDVNPAEALYGFSDSRLALAHDAHVQRDHSQTSAPCFLVLMRAHFFQKVLEIRAPILLLLELNRQHASGHVVSMRQ